VNVVVTIGTEILLYVVKMRYIKPQIGKVLNANLELSCYSLLRTAKLMTQLQIEHERILTEMQNLLTTLPHLEYAEFTPEVKQLVHEIYFQAISNDIFKITYPTYCLRNYEEYQIPACNFAVKVVRILIDPDMTDPSILIDSHFSDPFASTGSSYRIRQLLLATGQMLKKKFSNFVNDIEDQMQKYSCDALDFQEQLNFERTVIFSKAMQDMEKVESSSSDWSDSGSVNRYTDDDEYDNRFLPSGNLRNGPIPPTKEELESREKRQQELAIKKSTKKPKTLF